MMGLNSVQLQFVKTEGQDSFQCFSNVTLAPKRLANPVPHLGFFVIAVQLQPNGAYKAFLVFYFYAKDVFSV